MSAYSEKEYSGQEIRNLYNSPLLGLISEAVLVHRYHFEYTKIQASRIVSVKSGGCTEDCIYCSQSVRYKTKLDKAGWADEEDILSQARNAKELGCSRFCIGAAWPKPETSKQFDRILDLVQKLAQFEMEICCSLGMIDQKQAVALKEAGASVYNHNLDTSAHHYPNIITTRTFDDRINTIENIRIAGMKLCSGGILGIGESDEDRIEMICALNALPIVPDSIPINLLVPIPGTPLENAAKVSIWTLVRTIATLRIVCPTSRVRLSAGRNQLSAVEQSLCFIAGANSVFIGDTLLTTKNIDEASDLELFELLGLTTI